MTPSNPHTSHEVDSGWWQPIMPDHSISGVPQSADVSQLPVCPQLWRAMADADAELQEPDWLDSRLWPVNPAWPYERR